VRDRLNSSSLQVCDQVFDLDSVMDFGLNDTMRSVAWRDVCALASAWHLVAERKMYRRYRVQHYQAASHVLRT